ncbi:MAG: TonB-dependent receptor [Opitutae bacterium]|nr:TonB-dependent receptor [Opitutae bacterium]
MKIPLRLAGLLIAFAFTSVLPGLRAEAPRATAAVAGLVRDADTAEPIAYAAVQIAGQAAIVTTDSAGRFAFESAPAGRAEVLVRRNGYQPLRQSVQLAAGKEATLDLLLAQAPIPLAAVVVTPSRFDVASDRSVSGATLTSAEIATLPQLGEDLYRAIARLPGLAADDFTAKFWVRGAPNSQVLARLDGVELFEPFHLKDVDGALSVVDIQTINRLDLITGGATVDYGDRLAGVLAMETGPHGQKRTLTSLGLSVTSIRGAHQGGTEDGRAQWLVSARRGYPDVALKIQGRDDEVFPRYYDAFAKFEYRLTPHQTLALHVLHAADTMMIRPSGDPVLHSNYGSDYGWARWRGTFGEVLTGEAVLSYARLDWQRAGDGFYDQRLALNLRDDRQLNVAALRQDWTLTISEHTLLRTGFEAKTGEADYDYTLLREEFAARNGVQVTDRRTANLHLRPSSDTFAAYFAPRFQPWSALTVEPGVRFDRYDAARDRNWSPRFNASLRLDARTTLRAAWGLYYQSQGLHELAIADGDTAFHRAERAEQRVLSLDHRLPSGINLRAEAYQRLTSHLRPRWENTVNLYNVFPEVQSDRTRLSPQSGSARGIELLAESRAGQRFGWSVSYALAIAEEKIAGRTVPVARDQRHTFYIDGTYAPNPNWRFSAAWQYHTGWPTTDISYVLIPLNNGKRFLQRVVGPAYAAELPAYHRLDLRATRRFQLKHGELRVFLDIFNAYDRKNILGYGHSAVIQGNNAGVALNPRELLPILPSLGITWEF